MVDIRQPYPDGVPQRFQFTVSNMGPLLVKEFTLGFLHQPSSGQVCSPAISAYDGVKRVVANLVPGDSRRFSEDLSSQARSFCIIRVIAEGTEADAASHYTTRPSTGDGAPKYQPGSLASKASADDAKHREDFHAWQVATLKTAQRQASEGHLDQAISLLNAIIDLNPQAALALMQRGLFFAYKGDATRAVQDANRAVAMAPNAGAYRLHGWMLHWLGRLNEALMDYSKAIELDASNVPAWRNRGVAHFDMGLFSAAANDFSKALELTPDTYAALYLFVARTRAGGDGLPGLKVVLPRLDTGHWPYPVAELFLGKLQPAQVLARASSGVERCEAHFYIGQWQIMKGDTVAAERALREVKGPCQYGYIEHVSARAELARLKVRR